MNHSSGLTKHFFSFLKKVFGSTSVKTPSIPTILEIIPVFSSSECDENYFLSLNLGEFKKNELNLKTHDHTLILSGAHVNYQTHPAQSSVFKQTFILPMNAEPGNILSEYQNGQLRITIPKSGAHSVSESV